MDQSASPATGKTLAKRTAEHVLALFKSFLPENLVYHDYVHTRQVVRAARSIGKGMRISSDDLEIVTIAAWLHDIGFTEVYDGHEERGAAIATTFLAAQGSPQERIDQVVGCILATRMPQNPTNILQEIVCDADLAHLADRSLLQRNELLRLEWQLVLGKIFTDLEWERQTFEFLSRTAFHTRYASIEFYEGRTENLLKTAARIRELEESERREREKDERRHQREHLALEAMKARLEAQQRKIEHEAEEARARMEARQRKLEMEAQEIQAKLEGRNRKLELESEAMRAKVVETEKKLDDRKAKTQTPERGIETMFRVVAHNHMELSAMADNKSNIMISINALIISIVLSTLVSKLDDNAYLIIPTLVLLLVCLTTIIMATLATRPKITTGTFTPDDVRNRRANLLFFGNFYNMKLQDYHDGVMAMMSDRQYLYGSLISDTYYLGLVLARKYRFLRIAYTIFMYGLIVAVLSFGIAAAFFGT